MILASLTGIVALAWLYLLRSAATMFADGAMSLLGFRPWHALDFALVFLMWAIMMVAMMVPSAMPMTLIFAAVARKAARGGTPFPPVSAFVGGYIATWTVFSAGATIAQWGLDSAALLSPMMVGRSPLLGAGLLIAAGLYQMTPAKDACLDHCRSPVQFMARRWRPGIGGAFRMGAEHGVFCLGCCWLLMGLLFVGGVMNLVWVAMIAAFVLVEKTLPAARWTVRGAGVLMVAAGIGTAIGWIR